MSRKLKLGIAAKLYCFAFLSLMAVGSLAAASIYYSKASEEAANVLYGHGFIGVTNAARLELLLEHHRRVVESMPLEVDRLRIESDRSELAQVQIRLLELISQLTPSADSSPANGLEEKIATRLPRLFAEGEQVVFYAKEFAQDKAVERVNRYTQTATEVQSLVQEYRRLRLDSAKEAVAFVSETAKSLVWWVLSCVVIACILIGPIGLATTHHVLSRLRNITQAMAKLARNDTTTVIPSREDPDEVGEMARAVEIFKANAIQLIAREFELKQLNDRIDVAMNNMSHGLCMFDAERTLIVCNDAYRKMYQLPADLTQPGTPLATIQQHRGAVGQDGITTGTDKQAPSGFTETLKDGRTIAISQQPMADGGWVAVHEDITERRRSEEKIAHLARHDLVTNLPNRVLFKEWLENALQTSLSGGGACALHCLDLDHFKTVNDTLGHPVGDELLKVVGRRLNEVLDESDFVARIGGDEFALVQANVSTPAEAGKLASEIINSVSKPYDVQGKHIIIGASIGIAIAPKDGSDHDRLLKNADVALYLAKGDGRGTYRFFEREVDERLQAKRLLELDLRNAVENGEFELHYQPVIDLQSGKVTGFEALARWNHPERGQISPAEFISLAEETGLMISLGEWILRTACAQAAHWPEPLNVAVNISATQFKTKNLVHLAINALATSGLAPHRLGLEITESVLLHNETYTLTLLEQLRSVGIRISLDDFGVGFSSLSYLRNFPFDIIKIDRSFVQDMLNRKDCEAIVRAVVGLAQTLCLTTVIEGVETEEQMVAAKQYGCDEGQGHFFSKPMPAGEIKRYLMQHGTNVKAA